MKTGDRKAGVSRRTVVQGAAAASAASAASLLGFLGCDKAAPPPARPGDATAAPGLGFTPVPTSRADAVVVPRGYRQQVLSAWGDPVVAGAGGLQPRRRRGGAGGGRRHGPRRDGVLPVAAVAERRGARAAGGELRIHRRRPAAPERHGAVDRRQGRQVEGRARRRHPRDCRRGRQLARGAGLAVRPAHHGRHADRARGPGGGPRVDEDRRRPRRADRARHIQQLRVRQDAVGDVPDLRGERRGVFRPGLRRGHAPAAALRRRAQQGRVGVSLGGVRSALRRRPLSQRAQPPRLGRRDRSDGPEGASP